MELDIRATTSVVTQKLRLETTAKRKRLFVRASRKLKKKTVRNSLLAVNVLVLFIVFAFIVHNTTSAQVNNQAAITNTVNGVSGSSSQTNPLDQLSSAQIAVQVARMTGIYEATSVTNLADSQAATTNVVPSDSQVISKPTVIATGNDAKSNQDIVKYVAQNGDTVSSLAVKFGVTSNSILWSNSLTGNNLTAGQVLYIPPVNGIIYTVKQGDTAATLAQKYNANSSDITSFNDAEISGLSTGEQIVIPNGNATVADASLSGASGDGGSYSNSNYTFGYTPTYGSNGYDYGYCTWYVASQISVPSNWGNASSWATYAALSGWSVSPIPAVGSIAQTAYAAGGQGHVAIVTAVNGDQIYIKDMNNYGDGGGFGRVGGGWVSASSFQNYITH